MQIMRLNKIYNDLGEIKPVYRILLITGLLFVGALGISLLFPMFFRTDDALQISWISRIRFIDLFNVELNATENSIMKGTYRPGVSLFFMICWRLFGMNPFGYQIIYTMIFLFNFYLLFKLSKIYFNSGTGLLVLLIYVAFFYNHLQIAFWFSDITFTMNLMFGLLAIIFYIKSKENLKFILLSYLFTFAGAFTKEPAMLIVGAFVFADMIIHIWKEKNLEKAWILVPYVIIGLLLFFVSPTLSTRFGEYSDVPLSLDALVFRFRYYFNYLLSGSRNLIPLLMAVLYALSLPRSIWVKLVLTALAIPCYFNVYYFSAFLFIFSFLFYIQEKKLLPFLFWMLVTILPLPFMGLATPTYLFEFSFGISILLGFVVHKHLIQRYLLPFYSNKRKLAITVLIILLLPGLGVAYKPVSNQIKALRLVVETRRNLAEGIAYISENQAKIKQVVIPDEGLNIDRKLRAQRGLQSNIEKAMRNRTMEWNDVDVYLPLIQCNDIDVIPLSEFTLSGSTDSSIILLLQNNADIELAGEKNLIGSELFSYSHFNSNNILICQFNNTGLRD